MSISSLFLTARDSLLASQMAIDVTGANIANVNTPGYARQRAVIKSIGSANASDGLIQTSVTVDNVERLYDKYLEGQLITQKQSSGYASTMNDRLSSVENVLAETSGSGLTAQLNKFWSSLDSLASNPSGQVERGSVVANAQTLSSMIGNINDGLTSIRSDIKNTIKDTVSTINTVIGEISQLNEKIGSTGTGQGDTNTLQDKMMSLLGDLGEKIGINWYGNDDGTVNVALQDGTSLVQGMVVSGLTAVETAKGVSLYSSKGSQTESLNSDITQGNLGALINCQDNVIPKYLDRLNAFAKGVADSVNTQHQKGYDATGNIGQNFFTYDAANPAATIGVSSAITSNVQKVAASASVNGDGENATALAALQYSLVMDGNTATLNGYHASTVGDIGREMADSKVSLSQQTTILNNVSDRRESVSGVSIDEEMINLIKFQMGYGAAAKLAQTCNQMMSTLMSLGGTTA